MYRLRAGWRYTGESRSEAGACRGSGDEKGELGTERKMSEGRIDRRRGKEKIREGLEVKVKEESLSQSDSAILLYCLVMQILRRRISEGPPPLSPSPSPYVVLRVYLPFSRRAHTRIRTHAFIMRVISGAAYIVTRGAKRGERTFRRKQ